MLSVRNACARASKLEPAVRAKEGASSAATRLGRRLRSSTRPAIRRRLIVAPLPALPVGGILLREEARERGAFRRIEAARQQAQVPHPIGPEGTVVAAQLAPGGERPLAAPEVEAERARVALAGGAVAARVAEVDDAALADRAAQQGERRAARARAGEA